jgi:hypothetical protein
MLKRFLHIRSQPMHRRIIQVYYLLGWITQDGMPHVGDTKNSHRYSYLSEY